MNELSMNEQMTNATASWRVFDDITYKYVQISLCLVILNFPIGRLKPQQSLIIHLNFEIRVVQLERQLNHLLPWLRVEDRLVKN